MLKVIAAAIGSISIAAGGGPAAGPPPRPPAGPGRPPPPARLAVPLVEANATFIACPFSNAVIGGLRELTAQQFTYERVAADGIVVARATATAVDAQARSVTLADGARLPYDRLVLAPGIDIRWGALPGYDEGAAAQMPHAWKAGEQTLLLRRQLEAMDDGGLVVISAPANPFRCPPGPYERASLIAHYLKTKKPKSKVIVLDAKDAFSKQRLFQQAWAQLYPGLLEWVPLSKGGAVTSVDAATRTLVTDFGRHQAKVANVIPPQKAGRIAEVAGVTDRRRRGRWRRHWPKRGFAPSPARCSGEGSRGRDRRGLLRVERRERRGWDAGLAHWRQGRSGAWPRDRYQPPGGSVPALSQRAVS